MHPWQILILPPTLGKNPAINFHSIFGAIGFFLFCIPIILTIPILPILIPEETKKMHPKSPIKSISVMWTPPKY